MEKCMGLVTGLAMAVLLQYAAAQTVYTVGDGLGWRVPQDAQAYVNWANGKSFVVGDILHFQFNTNEHDVLRVPNASYDACTQANPIGSMITTGPANVTLDAAGEHYYICTIGRHCQNGQKLAITVSATPGASMPPSTTPTPTTPVTPSPGASMPPSTTPTPTTPVTPSPDECPPTPASSPANGPTTGSASGSNPAVPPPPSSSSSNVLGSMSACVLAITVGLFF